VKALTVQQPWAWAIIHGGKDVENRTQAWTYRGPLAIHAGARLSERGCNRMPDLLDETRPDLMAEYATTSLTYGAIIGVVDLVDVHQAEPETHAFGTIYAAACCESPWAEQSYTEHGGRARVHLELANPRPLPEPIPCRGALGLWTPPADVLEQLQAVT
jgi:hypothetical protein